MTDYALGRVPSLNPVRLVRYAFVPTEEPRSYTWACGVNLDQGQVGACVGFSWAAEAAAKPKVWPADNTLGLSLYHSAQELDEYPGDNYEGTSVDGGAKASAKAGYIGAYQWATSVNYAASAVSRHGPGIFGINWYGSMFRPDSDGYLNVTGSIAGGHAILTRGFSLPRDAFLLHNSWGADWGGTEHGPGTAWLRRLDADRLIREDGEFAIPMSRH